MPYSHREVVLRTTMTLLLFAERVEPQSDRATLFYIITKHHHAVTDSITDASGIGVGQHCASVWRLKHHFTHVRSEV